MLHVTAETLEPVQLASRKCALASHLDDGPHVTAETSRRIACDASIFRLVTVYLLDGGELLLFIETNYRSSPDKRIVFGHSLGGQFVLYSAQTEPGLFWGHIASNPALHRNLPLFLDMRPETPLSLTHVFVGDASEDDTRFLEPRTRWIEHWTGKSDLPWALHTETLEGHNHFSAPPASFRRGIRWLFADELDTPGQ